MTILGVMAIMTIISTSAIMITIAHHGCLKKHLEFSNTVPNFKTVSNICFEEKDEKLTNYIFLLVKTAVTH